MMPTYPGQSRVDESFLLPWRDERGLEVQIGNNRLTQPRTDWQLPRPFVPVDWHGLAVNPGVTATPDAVVPEPNVPGASRPDLIVVPGSASGSGGVSLGMLALLALLGVGGWFLYKRFAK